MTRQRTTVFRATTVKENVKELSFSRPGVVGRRGCRSLSALPVFWIKRPGGAAAHPQERGCNFQTPSGFGVPVVVVAPPEGRVPVQRSEEWTGSRRGGREEGRKEESLMDTRRRTLVLCLTSWERLRRGHADGRTVQENGLLKVPRLD